MNFLTLVLTTNLVSWMIIGLMVGLVVHLLDVQAKQGILGTALSGVIGGLLGGVLANILLGYGVTGFTVISLILASVGALSLAILRHFLSNIHEDEPVEDYPVFDNQYLKGSVYYSQVTPVSNPTKRRPKKTKDDLDAARIFQIDHFLDELNYPISKPDIIRYALDKDASRGFLSKLESLPDHIYDNKLQLQRHLEKVVM